MNWPLGELWPLIAQQRNLFLSGAYKQNLYAVVFASSGAILVKFIGSFMLQLLNRWDQ